MATSRRDESEHRQRDYGVRFDWGATGAAATAKDVDYAVVVDVLSFTTTLTVAVEQGITVFPYPWKDERAADFAADRDALLAVGRLEQSQVAVPISLSPAAMTTVTGVERIVLPSPNGSTIAHQLRDSGAIVLGACLRNATAVAAWLAPRIADGAVLTVIAAGERWPDGSLRPAIEDCWGAGAVLAACADLGVTGLSPEAESAMAGFRAVQDRLPTVLADCASGRELTDAGFVEDVAVAAAFDTSCIVPLLTGEAFVAAE